MSELQALIGKRNALAMQAAELDAQIDAMDTEIAAIDAANAARVTE